jgi:hypothetical protein
VRVKLDYEMKRELYERLVRASEDKTKAPETVKEQAAQRYHLKVVDEQIPIADEWVTQMLRQGDAQVFKKYSQMKREALEKINRQASQMPAQGTPGLCTAMLQ